MISIIVPVYNAAKCLGKCIESVQAQTYDDWQLVLVDDGSTDGSAEIADSYSVADDRIMVFHQPNGGASVARNRGLDIATGEWITFVDADDYIGPEYMRHLFDLSDGCDIVIDGWNINGRDVRLEACSLHPDDYLRIFHWGENLGFVCSKLYRRSLLDAHSIRFAEGVCWSEDVMMFYNAVQYARSIRIGDDVDYYYVQSAGSSIMRIHGYEREKAGYLESCRLLDELCRSISPDVWLYFNPYAFLWRTMRALYETKMDRNERLRLLRSLPLSSHKLHTRPTHWKEAILSQLLIHRCWRILDPIMRHLYEPK